MAEEDLAVMGSDLRPTLAILSRRTLLRNLKKWTASRDLTLLRPEFKLRDFGSESAVVDIIQSLLHPYHMWMEVQSHKSHREACPLGHDGEKCAIVLDGCAKLTCNMCPFHASTMEWNPDGGVLPCLIRCDHEWATHAFHGACCCKANSGSLGGAALLTAN
jgi:hypothetical protein